MLCEHNPQRRCSVNFSNKYLVNDVLRAKCDAPIRVEIIDRATGQPVADDLPPLTLELCVLDGNQYEARCAESAGEERVEDLESCALLLNNRASALLVPGPGGTHNADNKVVVPLAKGVVGLPDLYVSDSSEALLSGRKPPFRLLVRAVLGTSTASAAAVSVRAAVSEGFVVATRRTRTAGKVDIPNVDDYVGKLEHMGRETVKKLQDIRASALAAGVDIQVPDNCINKGELSFLEEFLKKQTLHRALWVCWLVFGANQLISHSLSLRAVGEFRKLALQAEANGHLRQRLQQVLKLSKEKWEEARDHAMRAVVADNRMRIWYADKGNMDLGLLFACRLGTVDLDRPVGLLTKRASNGTHTTMEATLMAQQTPVQREQVRALQPQAAAAWWHHGHPGWAIYPVDSDTFMATGVLDPSALPTHEQILPLPGQVPNGVPQPGSPYGFNAAFASSFANMAGAPVLPNDALLRAMGSAPYLGPGVAPMGPAFVPSMLPTGAPPLHLSGGMPQQQVGSPPTSSPFAEAQRGMHHAMPPPGGQPLQHQGADPPATTLPPGTSAFAAMSAPKGAPSLDNMPSLNLGNLQAMFGPDFKLPFSMQGFPSLPGASHLPGSGDLEALLAAHGGGGGDSLTAPSGRFPSLALNKFGSVDVPGPMPGRENGQGRGGGGHAEPPSGGNPGAGSFGRKSSGLESMQSIEHALADVQRPTTVHEAIEAAVAEVNRSQGLAGSKRK